MDPAVDPVDDRAQSLPDPLCPGGACAPDAQSLPDVRSLLEQVSAGQMSVEKAVSALPLLQIARLGDYARLDLGRAERKGVPEVIFSPGKSDSVFAGIVAAMVREKGLALAARVTRERWLMLQEVMSASPAPDWAEGTGVTYREGAGTLEVTAAGYCPPTGLGLVGVISAGTADVPVAEEAVMVATHMGCRVARVYDVGVAGVHRLLEPLAQLLRDGADVLIVAAGMEGALPSLVAGLVDLPVIGLPTSTGYGLGGDGTAALLSMLQSCSPGLVAVNIDNGVGAGAAAGLIARRRAARSAQ